MKLPFSLPAGEEAQTSGIGAVLAAGVVIALLISSGMAVPGGLGGQEAAVAVPEARPGDPVTIDFESAPDGTPACERCPVPKAFREHGVILSFRSPFIGPTDAWLVASGAYDPEGEETNHAVTAALTEEGFQPGVLILDLPSAPGRVSFRLRGSSVVPAFEVRAFGPDGFDLVHGAIARSDILIYRAARGGSFREERITVQSAGGVTRIELDGTGPPGHILLLDDLALWE